MERPSTMIAIIGVTTTRWRHDGTHHPRCFSLHVASFFLNKVPKQLSIVVTACAASIDIFASLATGSFGCCTTAFLFFLAFIVVVATHFTAAIGAVWTSI